MFAHLKGTIEKIELDHFVIDVNGVGYLVAASILTLANLKSGETVKIHIETLMRQEALQLFGFLAHEEHSWFRLLLNVQGVGPKVALGIIGSLGLSNLAQAIIHQDKVMLSRADGVGPKLAGRLLLELKDRLKNLDWPQHAESERIAPTASTPAIDDALSALMNLGYSRFEAQKALENIENAMSKDSSALIRSALQQMQHRKIV